jgi:hypothetical protein
MDIYDYYIDDRTDGALYVGLPGMRSDSDIHAPRSVCIKGLIDQPVGWPSFGEPTWLAQKDIYDDLSEFSHYAYAKGNQLDHFGSDTLMHVGGSALVQVAQIDFGDTTSAQEAEDTAFRMPRSFQAPVQDLYDLLVSVNEVLLRFWTERPTTIEGVEATYAISDDLRSVLEDLDSVIADAAEDDFPSPSPLAIDNAKRLLMAVFRASPRRYEVYPTPDAEVAIDAPNGKGSSVLLLCGSDGEVLCLVNRNGDSDSRSYPSVDRLPDSFIIDSLWYLEV